MTKVPGGASVHGTAVTSLDFTETSRRFLTVFAWLVAGGYLAFFTVVFSENDYRTAVPLLLVPVLFALALPLAVRAAKRDGDALMVWIVLGALSFRLLGSVTRYLIAFDVYGGRADAASYHLAGVKVAKSFRDGVFTVGFADGELVGTNFIRYLTGAVYTVIGPSKLGGFFVFASMSFLGLYLFYRAFCIAVPDGRRRRYALLILLLPSLLFWPSSIGKEAWMLLSLGATAYGAASLFCGRRGGFLMFVAGVAGVSIVRPHMALVVMLAVLAGYVIRPNRRAAAFGGVPGKLLGIVALLAIGALVLSTAQDFFGVDRFNADTIGQILRQAEERTGRGGSQFESPSPSITRFPYAAVSVLFRPFPNEARTPLMLLASMEGVVLAVLAILSWRYLRRLPRELVRRPYVVFCLVYALLFVFAFSTFGNFGLITRQRVQVFPFVLVLLALPPARAAEPDRLQTVPVVHGETVASRS